MSTRLQTKELLLLPLPSSVWASWATWIPIKPFAAYKLQWKCFLEYSILNFGLKIHYHTRFPPEEENLPVFTFPLCHPKQMWLWMSYHLQRKTMQSIQCCFAVHILTIALFYKVTGGSFKAKQQKLSNLILLINKK